MRDHDQVDDKPQAAQHLPAIDLSRVTRAPAARAFAWGNWIPLRQTTLLTGEGGVGKSLLAQQLATCTALGRPFLGMDTRQASALYLSCEDDAEELIRRQWAICEGLDVNVRDLAGKLHLVSMAGDEETALVEFDDRGKLSATARWAQFRDMAIDRDIGFAAFDNATDLMAGDHNDLHQVAAFVNLLTGFAIGQNGAALLLHHPNKGGADWLGSVAWHNKVRSRLIVKRSEDSGDGATLSLEDAAMLEALSARLVGTIREAIAIVDFWRKPDQVRRLRANIDTELMVSGIEAVQDQHQRIAVELTKLAEKRHAELLRP